MRRFGRRSNGGNVFPVEYDANDRFVISELAESMIMHLIRFEQMDEECLAFVCWILGKEMRNLGSVALDLLAEKAKNERALEVLAEARKEFLDPAIDHDDYANNLHDVLKYLDVGRLKKFKKHLVMSLSHLRKKTEEERTILYL